MGALTARHCLYHLLTGRSARLSQLYSVKVMIYLFQGICPTVHNTQ